VASAQEGAEDCLCLLCRSATGMALCDINRSIIESLKHYKPRVRGRLHYKEVVILVKGRLYATPLTR
jgi:hypothetical protein